MTAPNLIKDICVAASHGCSSSRDCRFSIKEGEATTMGWPGPEYDSNGERCDAGDPNRAHFNLHCRRCNTDWAVVAKHERIEKMSRIVKLQSRL